MAADRLLETVQFAKSKGEIVESGSTTSLLLSMAQTLRACMRDWPNMEDNILAGVERAEALVDLKRTIKEARRVTRSSPVDSLAFVCCDALFQIAEQWPVAKGAASEGITERKRDSTTATFNPLEGGYDSAKKPRLLNVHPQKETPRASTQFFPPYPEDDDEEQNETSGEGQVIDPMMFFNGMVKEESDEMSNSGRIDNGLEQADMDIWSAQNPLAAFAAVTSSTSHSMNDRDSERTSRIRTNKLSCIECGMKCFAKSQLDAHMNSHTGNRPFQCDYCEKNYKRRDHLSDHIKKNHPDEYAAQKQRKEALKNRSSTM